MKSMPHSGPRKMHGPATAVLVLLAPAAAAGSLSARIASIPHSAIDSTIVILALLIPVAWLVSTWRRSRTEMPYRVMLGSLGPRLGAGLVTADGTVIEIAGAP